MFARSFRRVEPFKGTVSVQLGISDAIGGEQLSPLHCRTGGVIRCDLNVAISTPGIIGKIGKY